VKKSILITGSSKGIGKFLAESMLEYGYFVFGCSRGDSSIHNDNYQHFKLDLSKEQEILLMFKKIRNSKTQFYGLLNNAGIASMNHVLLTPISTVNKIFNINFTAAFICSREAVKIMRKHKVGRIINFSTIAVPIGLEGETVYAASKSAVESFTKSFSKEVIDYGVTVNLIGPNPIKTNLIKNVNNDKLQNVINKQTIKRYGSFQDVLNVIDFYLNEKSDFITGQKIYLGGL